MDHMNGLKFSHQSSMPITARGRCKLSYIIKKKCHVIMLSLFFFSHRTIKMKPIEVNAENEQELLNTVYKYKRVYSLHRKAKFKVGDHVRVSDHRLVFDKSYTPNWSTAIFTIRKVQYNTDPITYLLKGLGNQEIEGSMYFEELQKVKNPNEYLVEKIIKRRIKNGVSEVRVKWLGFSNEYNEWIPESDLVD